MALMWKRFLYARRSRKGFFAQVFHTSLLPQRSGPCGRLVLLGWCLLVVQGQPGSTQASIADSGPVAIRGKGRQLPAQLLAGEPLKVFIHPSFQLLQELVTQFLDLVQRTV